MSRYSAEKYIAEKLFLFYIYQSMILYILESITQTVNKKEKINVIQSRKMYVVSIEVFQQTAEKISQFAVTCIHDIYLKHTLKSHQQTCSWDESPESFVPSEFSEHDS